MKNSHRYNRKIGKVLPNVSDEKLETIKSEKGWSVELAEKYSLSYDDIVLIRNS